MGYIVKPGDRLRFLGERPGSGDGERKTLLTRQIAFEPLPASALLNKLLAQSANWQGLSGFGWRVLRHSVFRVIWGKLTALF
jgi:hypothetical protein